MPTLPGFTETVTERESFQPGATKVRKAAEALVFRYLDMAIELFRSQQSLDKAILNECIQASNLSSEHLKAIITDQRTKLHQWGSSDRTLRLFELKYLPVDQSSIPPWQQYSLLLRDLQNCPTAANMLKCVQLMPAGTCDSLSTLIKEAIFKQPLIQLDSAEINDSVVSKLRQLGIDATLTG